MLIRDVDGIHNNDGSITLTLLNGSVVHLPKGEHSITVLDMENPADKYEVDVKVSLYDV